MVILKEFFTKHKPEFSLMTCLKIIEKRLELTKKQYKDSKNDNHQLCLKSLAEAYCMIQDIFNEIGTDPETLI